MSRSTFPLRLSDPTLRDAVREVAQHEHVSQNEYIEQAIRNDLVARGRLRALQLTAVAARMAELSDDAWSQLLEHSVDTFAEGESGPDPVQMRAMHAAASVPLVPRRAEGSARSTAARARTAAVLDAAAAFRKA